MGKIEKYIVFVPLAKNQADFYLKIASSLKRDGIGCIFISCHERSHNALLDLGLISYNFFEYKRKNAVYTDEEMNDCLKGAGIQDVNLLINHEKEFFEIEDDKVLYQKLYQSLRASDEIFEDIILKYTNISVIQELGGFISVQSIFFTSKAKGLANYFLEPSFFKGRVFFVKDQLSALRIKYSKSRAVSKEVENYVETAKSNKVIVIPVKDRRHYSATFSKMFNIYHVRRFFQKICDKYLLGLEEEFQYIYIYLKKHMKAIFYNKLLERFYSEIPREEFSYYPLHVPADMALTIRSTSYFNQLYLIEEISKSLKFDETLCIKEHPAMIGALSYFDLRKLLNKRGNIKLLKPTINNYEILEKCSRIFTVNSKAGAEASLFNKNVFAFGDAFYVNSPSIVFLDSVKDLYTSKMDKYSVDTDEVMTFFQNVWDETYEGEIYDLEDSNISLFVNSIKKVVL